MLHSGAVAYNYWMEVGGGGGGGGAARSNSSCTCEIELVSCEALSSVSTTTLQSTGMQIPDQI